MRKITLRQAEEEAALWLCSLLGREVEYVGISRDKAECDLKQRREMIAGGSITHEPAPPLRAAISGRVMILEGVEKAERNVLLLLNNLLENREMALDDGRFLVSLNSGGGDERHEATQTVPCSKDCIITSPTVGSYGLLVAPVAGLGNGAKIAEALAIAIASGMGPNNELFPPLQLEIPVALAPGLCTSLFQN